MPYWMRRWAYRPFGWLDVWMIILLIYFWST